MQCLILSKGVLGIRYYIILRVSAMSVYCLACETSLCCTLVVYEISVRACMAELILKVWSTVKIRGTRVSQKAIVPVGRPRPYSIITLNMRFIPKASLRASSQITASSYILERHLWVNNSKPFALTPTWSLAWKQTECITAGIWKLLDPKSLYWHSVNTKHAMLDQRRKRWADVV